MNTSEMRYENTATVKSYRSEAAFAAEVARGMSANGVRIHKLDTHGWPDYICVTPGAVCYLELKTDSALSDIQSARIIDAYNAGYDVAVVRPEGAMWTPEQYFSRGANSFAHFNSAPPIAAFAKDVKQLEKILRIRREYSACASEERN